MTKDRTGTYACRFGDHIRSTHLIVRDRKFTSFEASIETVFGHGDL